MSETNQECQWISNGIFKWFTYLRQLISSVIFQWIICLSLCLAIHAHAQVSSAVVAGITEDSSEARIPDAVVKLINVHTGTENDSKTDRHGVFLLPGVIPGAYTLQIEREGFATTQITGLILNVGDAKNFLIRMQIGFVTQTVSVDASGIAPNTNNASMSTVVDRQFVANIPLNGRSFQDLISMTPGIVTQSPQAIGGSLGMEGDFSVNGQRPDANSYTVDGVSADIGTGMLTGHQKIASTGSAAGTTALGTTQSIVSIDDLQEFRALTSSYSAEYGRSPGGQFTLLTRSGSDEFHGSFYDYVRNNSVDASDWFSGFNGMDKLHPYQQNDFGGTLGGPFVLPYIYNGRSKSFFFFSYEGLQVRQPTAPLFQFVPSNNLIDKSPTSLQLVLIAFPSCWMSINPPYLLPASTGLAYFCPYPVSRPSSINSNSIHVNHTFSPRISAFFRYGDTPSKSVSEKLSSITTNCIETQNDTLGVTVQISATKTNEFRVGYGASRSLLSTLLSNELLSSRSSTDLNSLIGIPSTYSMAAADVFIHSAGAGDSEINTDKASGSIHQLNIRDTFAIQFSRHLLRFGIDQRHFTSTIHPPSLSVEVDFFNPESLLNNLASDISTTKSLSAAPVFNEFAAFLQDEWRISKSVTISSGLRWEVDPAPHGKDGTDAYTLIGNIASPATLKLAPRGTSLWNTSWFNLAPRIGVAWTADQRSGRELVVRAGGGIFFDTDNRAAVGAFSALGFSATAHSENVPVPMTAKQLDFSVTPSAPYTNSVVFAYPRHLQLPYTIQWNVAVEKALGRNQTLTASYVGANGRRLLRERRTNINNENPDFGEVNFFPEGSTSNYQALQLKFQRSISPGMQVLASYVWSHTIDYGSTNPTWSLTRGNSDLDLRHNLEVAFSWDERSLSGSWFRKNVLGSWGADGRLTARTSYPVTLLGNIFSDPATGNRYFSGVDRIADRPLYLYGSQYPGGRMFNGGPNVTSPAFVLPDASSAGNAPRNILRGFGDNQINIAIRREVRLSERLRMQLRGETYNLFNHPVLGYIDPSVTNALFGQSTLMLNQSYGPTGSLYQPGGPRSLQISLRLHF